MRARRTGQGVDFLAEDALERAVYVISVAAELAGMHPQTLRQYDRLGLVSPARTSGRGRRYSHRDVDRLRRVQELSNAGVNLEGVRRILALEDQVARVEAENRVLRERQASPSSASSPPPPTARSRCSRDVGCLRGHAVGAGETTGARPCRMRGYVPSPQETS